MVCVIVTAGVSGRPPSHVTPADRSVSVERRREWNICAVSTALKSLPRSEGGFLFRKSAVGDPVGTADNHLSRNRLSSNQRQVLEVKEMAAGSCGIIDGL